MVLIPAQGLGTLGIFLFRPLTISPFASYIGNLQISPLCTFPSVHLTSTTSIFWLIKIVSIVLISVNK